MPIPRRLDRRPPDRDETRINERIRVPEVRLIGDDGNQVGVLKTQDALGHKNPATTRAYVERIAVKRDAFGDEIAKRLNL